MKRCHAMPSQAKPSHVMPCHATNTKIFHKQSENTSYRRFEANNIMELLYKKSYPNDENLENLKVFEPWCSVHIPFTRIKSNSLFVGVPFVYYVHSFVVAQFGRSFPHCVFGYKAIFTMCLTAMVTLVIVWGVDEVEGCIVVFYTAFLEPVSPSDRPFAHLLAPT